jgi:hypothetical protein
MPMPDKSESPLIAGEPGRLLGHTPQRRLPANREDVILRRLIWLYFWLLIFEGALRKWVVPALSAPLLVIRDPLVLIIYVQAARCKRFPSNGPMLTYFALIVSFILLAVIQITAGVGGGVLVSLYGLRTNFLHLPLIFVIASVFSYTDVLKIGKWVLILSLPMAALMVAQFYSSPGSWINAATAADAQQIQAALGKIRPAGTFSFATGVAHYFVLVTIFVIYALTAETKVYSRWLVWSALFSTAAIQPVSGSRLLVLGCGVIVVAAGLFGILNPHRAHKLAVIAIALGCAVVLLSLTNFFRDALLVFSTRWNDANAAEGGVQQGLIWRFFGGFLEPFQLEQQASLIGSGIGMGTNAASALMTGSVQFLLAEGEWARVVLEAGPLLGFSFLAYRIWIAGIMAVRAFASAQRGQLLSWLLAFHACRSMVAEQISQPTSLGFMVLVSGLCLASLSKSPAHGQVRSASANAFSPLSQYETIGGRLRVARN